MLLVVAHGSAELYGSDLQLIESIRAALGSGWDVTLVLPVPGPLAALAADAGATVLIARFPVLRKALLHPRAFMTLIAQSATATFRTARWLARSRADAVYINTLTIPTWSVAAALVRVPALSHVHEAEEDASPLITAALTAPLLLSQEVLTNSESARRSIGAVFPSLAARARVVHNGVAGPPAGTSSTTSRDRVDGPLHLALVGRLSPRKGIDVAVEAVRLLTASGVDVRLRVAGSTFTGYEWYEQDLRDRAAAPGLAGRVELLGFVRPTWSELERADVVLVPSRVEPFGNTAVEALLARRPVIASDTQGLAEIIRPEETGLLVAPDDPRALADAIARLAADPALRGRLAESGHRDAERRFGTARYAADISGALRDLCLPPTCPPAA